MRIVTVFLSCAILSGCALVESSQNTKMAQEQYIKCLQENAKVEKCENLRAIYLVRQQELDQIMNALKQNPPPQNNERDSPSHWNYNMNGQFYSCQKTGNTVNCF